MELLKPVMLPKDHHGFVAPPSLCALAEASRKLRRIADSNYVWRDYASRHFGLPQSEWSKFGAPYSGLRKLQESEFVRHVEQSVIRLLPRAPGFTEALAEFRRNPDETTAGHDFLAQIQSLVSHVSSKYEKPTEEWRRRSDEEYAAKRDWKAYYRQCYSLLVSKVGVKYVSGAHLSGGHRDSIYCLHSRSSDSDIVFSADEDGTVIVWDVERSKQIRTLRGCHKGAIFSICTLPHPTEECFLLTGGGDGRIVLLDWTRAGIDFSLRAMSVSHSDAVSSLSFCPETRMVCSGSADDTILAHCVDSGELAWRIESQRTGGVNVVHFLNRKYLATVGMDAVVRVWKRSATKAPKLQKSMKGHSNLVTSLATWTHDGQTIVISGSYDGTARLWNPKTGNCVRVLAGHDGGIDSLTVVPAHPPLLVCVTRYRVIRVWDILSGELVKVIPSIDPAWAGKPASGPASVLIVRDKILTTSDDLPTIKVWKSALSDQIVLRQSPRPVF